MRQRRPNSLQKWLDLLLWNFFGVGLPNLKEVQSKIVIGSIQSKKTPTEKLKMVNLFVDGTVTSEKNRLLKYQKNIMKKYQ